MRHAGHEESQTSWFKAQCQRPHPGPAASQASRPSLGGGGQIRLGVLTGVERRSLPGFLFFGGSVRGGGGGGGSGGGGGGRPRVASRAAKEQTPNYATLLATCRRHFVDQSLSRMGLLWGSGDAVGSAPPLSHYPCLPQHHPLPSPSLGLLPRSSAYMAPLSLFTRQPDIILQQQLQQQDEIV